MKRREKHYINTRFEIRELDESGTFSGYASTFGNIFPIWSGLNETVKRGAFKKTLKENGGQVPIFHVHDSYEQMGWGLSGNEDNIGLYVEGKLDIVNNPRARSQWALMLMAKDLPKAKMGLSMGFYVLEEELKKKKNEPDLRVIKEVQLLEYSTTPFPANPKAGVIGVRNVRDLIGATGQLSVEERALLLEELSRLEAAPPVEEPDRWIHSVLNSLRNANNQINEVIHNG